MVLSYVGTMFEMFLTTLQCISDEELSLKANKVLGRNFVKILMTDLAAVIFQCLGMGVWNAIVKYFRNA